MTWGKSIRFGKRALLLGGAAAVLWAAPALAQTKRHYDLPAGDASAAVRKVALQSGTQIMVPDADLAGVRANPLRGDYTVVEALRTMLADKGLEVAVDGHGTVVIRRAAAAAAPQAAETPVGAGEGTTADNPIIVTGSRIARDSYDTLEAQMSTSAEQIARRGYTNVREVLRDTPGFGPAPSQLGTQQGNLGIAQTFANFFNLGPQRTLTLVNGRRFVSSNTVSGAGGQTSPGSQVDLNMIPVGLIDRVDTIAIGGAPVYGSDAIAGTVNIILKDRYEGLQLTAQSSISSRGDAANQTVGVLAGKNFAGGRGNIVVSGEYTRQTGMVLAERFPFRYLTPSGNTDPDDGIPSQMVVDALRYAPLTAGGLPYSTAAPFPFDPTYIRDGAGQPVMFGPDGNLVPFVLGEAFFGSSSSGIPIFRDGGDGLDPARYTSLLSPNERYLFNANANFDITDGITFFVESAYAHTSGTKLSDLFQYAAPNILGGPTIRLSVDNPFLSDQARDVLVANGVTDFYLNRNLNDIVDRFPAKNTIELYRIVTGFKGDFQVGGQTWNWNVSYNYGHSRNDVEFNSINLTRFLRAIDAVRVGDSIVCASGGDCVPLNLFGEGAASDAAVDYVLDRGRGKSVNAMEVIQANLGGRLGWGIAGPIAFNLGFERRKETGYFEADDIMNGGLSLLGGAVAFPDAPKRGFHTHEFYGETIVPLINADMGLPVIRSLSFEGKVRYVDHSVAGGDVTWAAGGRLETRLDGLSFRGVYTRAIRAPSIVELYLNTTPIAGAGNDVCAASRVNSGPNPAVRLANCTAALAAVGGPAPADFVPTTNGASPFGTSSGNPDLENERARSYSFGLTYQPPGTGLQLAIDYSRIKLTDAISTFSLGAAQSACYDSPNFPNEAACAAFSRLDAAQAAAQSAATGRTRIAGDIADGYRQSYYNTAKHDFAGVTAQLNYVADMPNLGGGDAPGQLRLGLQALYVTRYNTQTSGGSPVVKVAGTVGTPRWTVTGTVGYNFEPFDLDVQVRWFDKTVGDHTATIETTPINNFPSYTLVNTTLGFQVAENFRLQAIVNNLFDKGVPFAAQVTRQFSVYDPIGRTFAVRAAVNF